MRDLAATSDPPITTYSHDEILAELKAGTGLIDAEYEVRTYDGRLSFTLPKVGFDPISGEFDGDAGVIDAPGMAQWECNVDQEIAGMLRLTMLPVEELRYASNAFEIWPYLTHEFPHLGVVGRWQQGCYPWQPVERTIEALGHEIWALSLPDRSSILEDAGPGIAGWTISSGTPWRVDIRRLVERGGLDPDAVILPDSDEAAAKFIKWWYQEDRELKHYEDELQELSSHPEAQPGFLQGKVPGFSGKSLNERGTYWTTQVRMAWAKNYIATHEVRQGDTTLWQIIGDEADAAGWERGYFDWKGRLVIRAPVNDLSRVQPDHMYETGPDSIILLPMTDAVDITAVRNRGFGVATGRDVQIDPVQVLLEEISPEHPACESNGRPGAWKDFTRYDDKAGSAEALRSAVAKELRDRANASRSLAFSSLVNPAHEVHDFAGMRCELDAELANGVTFHSRRLAGDFCDHTMTHQHYRVWVYGNLPAPTVRRPPAKEVEQPAPAPPDQPWSPTPSPVQPGQKLAPLIRLNVASWNL